MTDITIKNILLVESKNDQAFIEKLVHYLKLPAGGGISVVFHRYEDLNFENETAKKYRGLSVESLTEKLKMVRKQLTKSPHAVEKIGILIDADYKNANGGKERRLGQISEAVSKAFDTNIQFEKECEFYPVTFPLNFEDTTISFSCFLMKDATSEGNLDTVLKAIAKSEAKFADCLNDWKQCLIGKGCEFSETAFTKLWLNFYLRYDTATKDEQSDAEAKLRFENVMEQKGEIIFDLEHKVLEDLKAFIVNFK